MTDFSFLDRKYFVDGTVYNCPFCNRNNVPYRLLRSAEFDWSESKKCHVFFVECTFCNGISMHSSFEEIVEHVNRGYGYQWYIKDEYNEDIDSKVFHSQPTSFFVLDERIPRIIRELITEAEGCLKMNFMTGASACMRKAIYEFLVKEGAEGSDYENKIKSLKKKYSNCDSDYFDILSHIKDMTSEKVHEQSWDKWDSKYLKLIIETLKSILYDIYVIPEIKKERSGFIQSLREKIIGSKNDKSETA